jgi:hypothetical protein
MSIEIELNLEVSQEVHVMIEYSSRRVLLHRDAHAHDASRGFVSPPLQAWVQAHGDIYTASGGAQLMTRSAPDASMPFNVVTVCSSAFSLFLGSMLNLFVKAGLKRRDITA